MPVTAKLSQRFYERFGDDLTNELVDWFNSVDSTYRSDLRDLNEANFARFDGKLEQRISALEVKVEKRISALEVKVEKRISALEVQLNDRISALEVRLNDRISALEAKVDVLAADLRKEFTERLAAFETRLMRWMFALWTSTMLAMAGLFIAILRK